MFYRVIAFLAVFQWVSVSLAAEAEALEEGLVNPGFHEQPTWFKNSFLDLTEDAAEAREADKRLILYFFQDGCPYCAKLLDVNFAQREIVEKTRQNFDVISINMWGDREITDFGGESMTEKQFAEKYRVMFTPTLLFFDGAGKKLLRVNGYYAPSKFMAVLDYASGKEAYQVPFRQYWAKRKPPATHGSLHQQPFFLPPPHDLKGRLKPGRHLAVLFEQKQCPACDEFHREIVPRPETREQIARLDVVQLDMWSKTPVVTPDGRRLTAKQWAKDLDVKYAPSAVFFDSQGREVFRWEAYLRAFHVQSSLDYVASSAYKRLPSFQRFIEERADGLRERGVKVDIWR